MRKNTRDVTAARPPQSMCRQISTSRSRTRKPQAGVNLVEAKTTEFTHENLPFEKQFVGKLCVGPITSSFCQMSLLVLGQLFRETE